MNSEEGVSLAKMAVTVLLVVLVIGAVVAIVYKAYSWFNSGSDKLEDNVTSIGSSAYSQYDDVNVKGTDVLTALKSYRDADFAVVICNLQTMGGKAYTPSTPLSNVTTGISEAKNYCGLITTGQNAPTVQTDGTYNVTVKASSSDPADGEVVYSEADGKYFCTNLFYQNGIATKNTNFSPTQDSSKSTAFVKQTGTFYSKLIYSKDTGDVCGVIFLQIE